jgi:hypothetical protein
LLGGYRDGKLRYFGHSGSGFSEKGLQESMERLKPLFIDRAPVANPPKNPERIQWVRPHLVCEVAFAEWTQDGELRQMTNRKSRRTAWAALQRLRTFLEENGARIGMPDDRNFETEGEALESGLKRTIAGRDAVMRSVIRAVYRFRDATVVAEKKDDFGNALQNLYRELERAENLVGPL